MKALGAPGFTAVVALTLAALVHPALRVSDRFAGAPAVVAALALLLPISLFASGGGARRWMALPVALAAASFGYDAVRGHRGLLRLAPGEASENFEEVGPGGRRLGLRPLGFETVLERHDPAGAVLLVGPRGQARLLVSPQRAVSWAGFRLGSPRRIATGEAASLRVTVTGPAGPQAVDVVPGQLTRAGDLEIGVERYFPDFALDERQQPFSRSLEPRNPAALLQVRRGGQAWRVFVIAAMPGIHRPEGLDRSFSLLSMTPLETVEIAVAREPAAPLAGAALLLLAAAAFSSAFET